MVCIALGIVGDPRPRPFVDEDINMVPGDCNIVIMVSGARGKGMFTKRARG